MQQHKKKQQHKKNNNIGLFRGNVVESANGYLIWE